MLTTYCVRNLFAIAKFLVVLNHT